MIADTTGLCTRLARLARFLGWAIAGLVLSLSAAWTGAYFWLGSSPGRAQLLDLARGSLPPAVNVEAVRWGPRPDELALGNLVVRGPDGRALVSLQSGTADVDLAALLAGEVTLDRVELEVARVSATADDEGRFDLAQALLGAPVGAAVASGEAPVTREKAPRIGDLRVYVHELALDLGDAQIDLRELRLEGALGGSATARIALTSGPCHASWNKSRRLVGFTQCRLAGSVEGNHIAVTALELWQTDEVLALQGQLTLGDRPHSTWSGRGHLGAREADALARGSFPLGLDFDGLALSFEGVNLSGSVGQVFAPRWTSGPFSADGVSFGVDHFTAEPGLLVPKLHMAVSGLSAAHVEGLDWRLEGLWIPRATGTLDRKLIIDAAGSSSAWSLPTGEVGPVELRATTQLKLTGGSILVEVESTLGLVLAIGTFKTSPLTKRTDFSAEVAFAEARGPLAGAFLHDLDAAQREALGDRVSGKVALDIEVEREDRFSPWVTQLDWTFGRLDGKVSLAWDGYGWGAPEVIEPSAPVEEEAP